MNLTQMRRKVRSAAGIVDETDPDLTNDDIDLNLNLSYWEIAEKFPFREKERTGTFRTTAGTVRYEMPKPFEAIQSLAIVDPVTAQHRPLDPITADTYESWHQEGDRYWGYPTHYLREDCYVRLWPTPRDAYTLVIRRLVTLGDIQDSDQVMEIPKAWWEIVLLGAQARTLADLGDMRKSVLYYNMQASKINSMPSTEEKEKEDYHRAGLEVITEENYW